MAIYIKKIDDNRTPILFIHGLGMGSFAYLSFVKYLANEKRSSIIVELPNISFCEYIFPHPKIENIVDDIKFLLDNQKINKVSIIANSYGTHIQHLFNIRYSSMVHKNIYSDPTCFVINQSKFLPVRNNKGFCCHQYGENLYKKIVFAFIFKDPIVDFILKRTCFLEHTLLHSLSKKDAIMLGSRDVIVPSKEIKEYLSLYHPEIKIIERNSEHCEIFSNIIPAMELINEHFND